MASRSEATFLKQLYLHDYEDSGGSGSPIAILQGSPSTLLTNRGPMKGRRISMMKKWWMIAVVFALALSLTSCGKRSAQNFSTYGINYCDGSMGSIDVYTVPVVGQPGTFKVVLIPVSLAAPGDVATVTVVNQSSLAYKTLVTQVVLNVEQEITAGVLSEQELNNYDLIAITSFVPGIDFLQANPEKDAICGLPLIGEGVQ
jgi:hypothetical protein